MSFINFGNNASQFGAQNALAMGLQFGQQAAEGANRRGFNNALMSYDPSNADSWKEVAKYDPRTGMALRQETQQQQAATQLAQDTQLAMNGDPEAKQRLLASSFERWKMIDGDQKKAIAEEQELFGQAALYALSQRDPRLIRQTVVDFAQRTQNPEVMQIAQLPDDRLMGALRKQVFEAEMVKDLIANERPDYMVVPKDADAVNTRDPAAVRQFQQSRGQVAGRQVVRTGKDAQGRAVVQYDDGTIEYAGGAASNGSGGF